MSGKKKESKQKEIKVESSSDEETNSDVESFSSKESNSKLGEQLNKKKIASSMEALLPEVKTSKERSESSKKVESSSDTKSCSTSSDESDNKSDKKIKKETEKKSNKDIKKNLGQFYTTNYDYILQNMSIPIDVKNIIEPFAGKGDLLKFINIKDYNVECYDIEPKQDYIIKKDTLNNPPDYKNKFILTNPPYLAKNKCSDKTIFNKYKTNDLYKCFFEEIIRNPSIGGIVIVPLNFLCSIRKSDINLRMKFLNVYSIKNINIFEEKVFKDTSYTVCCFQFEIKNDNVINAYIYPSKNKFILFLNNENNYTIGGEIYNLKENKDIIIERLTKNNINEKKYIANILLKCIDDSSSNKICLSIVSDKDIYADNTEKLSARSYASFIIKPKLSTNQQKKVVKLFNRYMEDKRKKYNSLFLTNYRESNTISRKRISFGLAIKIINYFVNEVLNQS